MKDRSAFLTENSKNSRVFVYFFALKAFTLLNRASELQAFLWPFQECSGNLLGIAIDPIGACDVIKIALKRYALEDDAHTCLLEAVESSRIEERE